MRSARIVQAVPSPPTRNRQAHSAQQMPSVDMVHLDMQSIMKILDAAYDVTEDLHGQDVAEDVEIGPRRKSNERKAEISRDLLYLQQILTVGAAEAGMRYHELKGRTDPRGEEIE